MPRLNSKTADEPLDDDLSEVLLALETKAPRWASAIVVLCAAALAARGAKGAEGAVVGAGAAAMGIYAVVVAFRARARVADLALALAPAIAASVGGVAAFGLADPLAQFHAQEPGGRAMLALRAFVFVLACFRVPMREKGATFATALLGMIFVASLAARGLVPALVVASALVIRRFARGEEARPSRWTPWVLAALASLPVLAFAASYRHEAAPPSRSASEQVDDWRARDNLFRARAVALDWAKREDPPGDAHLALASIDWELGHFEPARKVLSKVIARPASDDAKRRAEDLARTWGDGSR
jgi:hypothetical protein